MISIATLAAPHIVENSTGGKMVAVCCEYDAVSHGNLRVRKVVPIGEDYMKSAVESQIFSSSEFGCW